MIKRKLIYLKGGIVLVLLLAGILFVAGLTANRWNPDSAINASLSVVGARLKPSVFYKDSSWYSIIGNESGNFFGFSWNGTQWKVNTTINASLPDIGAYSTPSVFYKDSSWYMISGEIDGKFYGYVWNGTQWKVNTTINASLPDIGSNSAPSVFYKDSSWYLISGALNGKFYGYVWNGTQWKVNTTINASLQDVGSDSTPSVFYKDSSWYLISGEYYGIFYGFNWNGTQWLENSTILHLLPDIGTYSAPSVFYKDSSWYMISGNSVGVFYGFNWTIISEGIHPTYDLTTIGVNNTLAGEITNFYVSTSDDSGLSGFYLEHNNTGTWQNETFTTFYEVSETNYTYYFSNVIPTHGQTSGTDIGVLINSAPTTDEIVTCGSWIGYWFDEEENLTDWHISKIYWHVYYNSSVSAKIGYQLEGTYDSVLANFKRSPNTSIYTLYESTWDVDYISPNDISNKSLFMIKLTGGDPEIISGPGTESYIVITGGVPTTWANHTLTLNDSVGSTIGYRWYFNDTSISNNWNSTNIEFLTTTSIGTIPPTYSQSSINNTLAGQITLFAINVSDNSALELNGQYVFSTNNTGIWINDSTVNFTATPEWANVTKTLNSTVGTIVSYRWYINDTDGNRNSTPIYTLTTTDTISPGVSIVFPTSGQVFTTSTVSFEVRTNENSTCNYSVNSGTTNYSMTANSTGTGFTASKTLSNGDYVANYYCSDISGNLNNTEGVSFSVGVSSSRGGSSGTFKPTQKQLEKGYEKILNEERIVQINLSNGEQYLAEIKEINKTQKKVVVNVNGSDYSILENSSEKIDLNGDGYYDLEISVIQIYSTGYAKIEFKEIYEKIPRESEEAVTEKVVDNDEDLVNNKYKIIYYVLGFIVLALIIGVVFRKIKRGKRN